MDAAGTVDDAGAVDDAILADDAAGTTETTWRGGPEWTAGPATLDGRHQGRYAYRVTDAHGCRYNGLAEIPKTPDLTGRITMSGIIRCAGQADGSLTAEVAGGTPPTATSGRTTGNRCRRPRLS